MIDLSRQQRWTIIVVICAFVIGAVVLARGSFGSRADVYSLDEPAENPQERPDQAAEAGEKPEQMVFYVHVCGAVQKPGVYQLPEGTRCFQAIEAAGGATPTADTAAINLAAKIMDGEQIYLPKRGEAPQSSNKATARGHSGKKAEVVQPSWPLDINSATGPQLEAVPGIGPAMAARILAYRSEKGRFTSMDQLTEVSGIGDKRLAQLRPYLCVR